METEEERINREFDELNEGLVAMQIIEWFEKEHPEPHPPEGEINNPASIAWAMWDQWQRELVLYADGWKDALKALQERQYLEKCLDEEASHTRWYEYVFMFPEEFIHYRIVEPLAWWNLGLQFNAVDSWREELEQCQNTTTE